MKLYRDRRIAWITIVAPLLLVLCGCIHIYPQYTIDELREQARAVVMQPLDIIAVPADPLRFHGITTQDTLVQNPNTGKFIRVRNFVFANCDEIELRIVGTHFNEKFLWSGLDGYVWSPVTLDHRRIRLKAPDPTKAAISGSFEVRGQTSNVSLRNFALQHEIADKLEIEPQDPTIVGPGGHVRLKRGGSYLLDVRPTSGGYPINANVPVRWMMSGQTTASFSEPTKNLTRLWIPEDETSDQLLIWVESCGASSHAIVNSIRKQPKWNISDP